MALTSKTKRTLLYSFGGVVLFIGIVVATVLILKTVTSNTATTDTPVETTEQAQTRGDEARAAAQKHEEAGETQAALNSYQEASAAYTISGDEAAQQGVQLQIDYMKRVLEMEKTQKVESVMEGNE